VLAAGFAVVLVALVVRLSTVQVVDGARYASYASSEVSATVPVPATRGAIYDRNGNLIAISEPRVDVVADDIQISNPVMDAVKLAGPLHVSAATLEPELARHGDGYVVLARQVNSTEEANIARLGISAITFLPDDKRVYLDQTVFEPIVGGVDAAGVGDADLETEYNNVLSGHSGSESVDIAANGEPLPSGATAKISAVQGTGLVLTIDQPLQVEATKEVTDEMLKTGAQTGVAVVEDVHTGAILAMVDLARDGSGHVVPAGQNLALTAIYQPGSVMKLATFSLSLQDHLIAPGTYLSVPDQIKIGGYTFEDAEWHPTEQMSASTILAQSSNVGTIEVSRLLGAQRLAQALGDLGFGKLTGMNWPGETAGIIGSPATWYGSALGSVPIGTGVAVAPMQVLDAYNAVANDGIFVTPHLVAGTVSANGVEKLAPASSEHRVLDKSTIDELVPMLEDVVDQDGTAVCASIPNYTVAGKTGTAQAVNASGTGYVKGDWNATFVGFVPAQAPELSGLVWLNHPEPIYGGSVSAPVFASIMGWALQHFGIAAPAQSGVSRQTVPSTCNGQ